MKEPAEIGPFVHVPGILKGFGREIFSGTSAAVVCQTRSMNGQRVAAAFSVLLAHAVVLYWLVVRHTPHAREAEWPEKSRWASAPRLCRDRIRTARTAKEIPMDL